MSVIDELSIARKTFDDMTFENDIGTDAIRTTFDYVCPLSQYNKDEVSQAVNRAINSGNNFKKDKVWDKFATFPTQS